MRPILFQWEEIDKQLTKLIISFFVSYKMLKQDFHTDFVEILTSSGDPSRLISWRVFTRVVSSAGIKLSSTNIKFSSAL